MRPHRALRLDDMNEKNTVHLIVETRKTEREVQRGIFIHAFVPFFQFRNLCMFSQLSTV